MLGTGVPLLSCGTHIDNAVLQKLPAAQSLSDVQAAIALIDSDVVAVRSLAVDGDAEHAARTPLATRMATSDPRKKNVRLGNDKFMSGFLLWVFAYRKTAWSGL
jgi:hypothetical protein